MIDQEGYRLNVGIVIYNSAGQVLWARRVGQNTWQFPQGGMNVGESAEQAMFRELYEELGLKETDVRLVTQSRFWLKYKLPRRLIRKDSSPVCIGQKQKWFLLKIVDNKENNIAFDRYSQAEFDGWRWVSFWYPIRQVISFKRDVYRKILKEFFSYTIVDVNSPNSKNNKFKNRRFKC